ncbi:MAG: hypothetical protein KAU21_16495 [Gammaproteobacteria bacterium]|nr:hypothetical protein [Gammaproteobacteria bacterium]
MHYSLFLYAESANELTFSKAELINHLTELGFISSSANSLNLYAGNKLMDFITFLGCSPALKLGEIESTIKIHHFKQLTGLGGESIETIRYPTCKHPIHDPAKLLKSFTETASWQCPNCELKGEIDAINWRKSAGFSKIFIEVSQIFPKEAVPSDKLLEALHTFTKYNWKWFYSKASSATE